jgi:hypothetical protein
MSIITYPQVVDIGGTGYTVTGGIIVSRSQTYNIPPITGTASVVITLRDSPATVYLTRLEPTFIITNSDWLDPGTRIPTSTAPMLTLTSPPDPPEPAYGISIALYEIYDGIGN